MNGILIAIEGIDGAGKTTLLHALATHLRGRTAALVCTGKEPTDGPFGAQLRASALTGRKSAEEELDLLLADRRQHVEAVIAPTLAAGGFMLLDRYYYSTAAYQGAAGLPIDRLLARNREFAPRPDLLLIVDVAPEVGLARVGKRGDVANHFEIPETLSRARGIFLQLAASEGGVLLDGNCSAAVIFEQALHALHLAVARKLLAQHGLGLLAIEESQRLLGRLGSVAHH
jgi:dTMP kinase